MNKVARTWSVPTCVLRASRTIASKSIGKLSSKFPKAHCSFLATEKSSTTCIFQHPPTSTNENPSTQAPTSTDKKKIIAQYPAPNCLFLILSFPEHQINAHLPPQHKTKFIIWYPCNQLHLDINDNPKPLSILPSHESRFSNECYIRYLDLIFASSV